MKSKRGKTHQNKHCAGAEIFFGITLVGSFVTASSMQGTCLSILGHFGLFMY